MAKEFELTDEQKGKVIALWKGHKKPGAPSINDLTKQVFGKDGRSIEGRAIKKYLAQQHLKTRSNHDYYQQRVITLNDDQREFVANNAANMKAVEIAKVLFDKKGLTNLSAETRVIIAELKTLNRVVLEEMDNIELEDYSPPKSESSCISLINKNVTRKIDKNNLPPKTRKDIKSLIGFLHTPRFLHQMNTYETRSERSLFESAFIRYTYDKYDLTEEEIDQYIILSTEVVNGASILGQIETLRKLRDQVAEDQDGKISMSIVEAVGKSQTEYNQCVGRQQKLLKALTQDRREKIENKLNANNSLLNFVELMKKEETRKEMLEIARKREAAVQDEIERIKSIDQLKMRIVGSTEDQATYAY